MPRSELKLKPVLQALENTRQISLATPCQGHGRSFCDACIINKTRPKENKSWVVTYKPWSKEIRRGKPETRPLSFRTEMLHDPNTISECVLTNGTDNLANPQTNVSKRRACCPFQLNGSRLVRPWHGVWNRGATRLVLSLRTVVAANDLVSNAVLLPLCHTFGEFIAQLMICVLLSRCSRYSRATSVTAWQRCKRAHDARLTVHPI